MISNQVLQSTLEGLKNIARIELCVLDTEGKAYAFTNQDMEKYSPQAVEFVRSPADSQEIAGCQFFKIYDEQQLEYILVKPLLISYQQVLYLESHHFTESIYVLGSTLGNKDILKLLFIIYLKELTTGYLLRISR